MVYVGAPAIQPKNRLHILCARAHARVKHRRRPSIYASLPILLVKPLCCISAVTKSADMELLERLYKLVRDDPAHKGGYYASKIGDVTRSQVNRCLLQCLFF